MTKIERMFVELTGRKAMQSELKYFNRIRDVMRICDNDAIWWIIIVLQAQATSASVFALRSERTAERYAKAIRDAGKQVNVAVESVLSELDRTSRARNGENRLGGIILTWVLFFVFVFGGGYLMFQLGHDNAVDTLRGYSPVAAAKLFDAPLLGHSDVYWMLSDEGQRAREVARDGRLDFLETSFGRVAFKAHREGVGLVFADIMTCQAPGTVLGADGTCEGRGVTWRAVRD